MTVAMYLKQGLNGFERNLGLGDDENASKDQVVLVRR